VNKFYLNSYIQIRVGRGSEVNVW